MRLCRILVVAVILVSAALACDFKYDPASVTQYYRSAGWKLPGTGDIDPSAPLQTYALPAAAKIPGVVAQIVKHEDPYIVDFPAQEFVVNGKQQRMRAVQAKVEILRWVMDGRVIAYSYSMIPVTAHRHKGKWLIESEYLCIFFASFIDDKGDGVFRVLVPGEFAADLVPSWAKARKN